MRRDKNVVNGSHEVDLSLPKNKDIWLGADELGLLAQELMTASNAGEAARVRECLVRGFYGV